MADVFVSYAREDKGFVKTLCGALAERDVDIWVDWEGIPFTAEWMEEISRAIEAADNFLFVISPSSVRSQVCLRELAHAEANSKRLVPVVLHEVDADLMPEALARLNWIFMTKQEDFPQGTAAVEDALSTDLEWVRFHSRLLVRAKEWEAKGQDKSAALRGGELEEAEQRLAGGSDKEPQPGTLQVQFVHASRMAARRRLRGTLSAVSVALVISSVLAVLAFLGRQEAQRQSQISLSRQLAAQSSSVFVDAPDLGILLGLEAGHAHDTFEARTSMWAAIDRTRYLDAFLLHPRDWRYLGARSLRTGGVAFSPDGAVLAAASWDNKIEFFDPETKQRAADALQLDAWPYCVAFSPSGHLLAVGDAKGMVFLWNVNEREIVREIYASDESIMHLAFSPDGQWLAVGSYDGNVALWDASKNQVATSWRAHTRGVTAVAFGLDGQWLASGGFDEAIRFWKIPSGEAIGVLPGKPDEGQLPLNSGKVNHLALHPAGSLIGWSLDEAVVIWDLSLGKLHRVIRADEGESFTGLAFGPGGDVLTAGGVAGTVFRWQLADGEPMESFGRDAGVVDGLAFSPDGRTLASLDWHDGAVALWHLGNARPLVRELGAMSFPPYTVTVGPGSSKVAVHGTATAAVWDIDTGARLSSTDPAISELLSARNTPALGPNDDLLALGNTESGQVAIIDLAEDELLYEPLLEHTAGVWELAFSPDGALLASADSDGLLLLRDVATGETRASLASKQDTTGQYTALAFHPDGQMIAVGLEHKGIALRNVANGLAIEGSLDEHSHGVADLTFSGVADLAFSPDGSILASIGLSDFTVYFWDVATRAVVATVRTDSVLDSFVDFSPDGRVLAISGDGITFIDVGSYRELGSFDGDYGDATFSPDGRTLASTQGKKIVLWNMDSESWRERLCRRANRNLTLEEWSTYIGRHIDEYRPTCDF